MDWGAFFLGLLITAIAYMAFPLIRLSMNGGKFEQKQARKIALWNSIVVGAVFLVLTAAGDSGTAWNAAPAFLYYWIRVAILRALTLLRCNP